MERKGNALKIIAVKTNLGCFISDCLATSGYDYNYHRGKVQDLFFDGEKATGTFYPNWYFIKKYPEKIEELHSGESYNIRYEIIDKDNITKALPEVINREDSNNYSDSVLDSLYHYKYDTKPDFFIEIPTQIEVICEIEDMKEIPHISYSAVRRSDWKDRQYTITNVDVHHQLFDKMVFPEVLLHEKPCKFTSKQMYDITRQYVKDHINRDVATISSDYDFCFEVRKIIPLLEPETIAYQNIFARTKRERSKTHYKTHTTKEITIFSMTHDQENYKGYTAIEGLSANSETELKEKVDTWLEGLMEQINKSLCQCPYCNGTGYTEEMKSVDKNKVIKELNEK